MFAGADADNFLDRLNPNLAVSNGTGASGVADNLDNSVDMFIGADEGELHLRDRVDKQLVAAHVFLPAMLRAAALHLVNGHTTNISSKQRVLKNLELFLAHDSRNLLHSEFLSIKEMNCHSTTRVFEVPEIAPKEERRVLRYASDGLRGKVGCLGKPRDD